MSRAMINTIVTIALSLLVMFRRPAGAVLPLVIVGLSLLTTLGLMAALNIAIKVPTQILPTFILVVGVADAIHILTLYFRCIDNGGDRPAALEVLLSHAGGSKFHLLTDDNFFHARISLKLSWTDANKYARFIDAVYLYAKVVLPKSGEVAITGLMTLSEKFFHGVRQTTVVSYLIAFSGIS